LKEKDILIGLEQKISAYRSRLQEQKKRRRLEEEIATIKQYLELAETLSQVEADTANLVDISSQIMTDDKGGRFHLVMNGTDQSHPTLGGRTSPSENEIGTSKM
jgi:hypothetical protein